MHITLTCNECDNTVHGTLKEVPHGIEILVDPCPVCIARQVQLAKENGWIFDNIMRKGRIA